MANIKGYPSTKKEDSSRQEYVTINRVREGQSAIDVVAHNAVVAIASDTVEASSTVTVINATGHSARVGDVIRFTSGTLSPRDIHVREVTANTITLSEELPSAPTAGDGFDVMRFTYQTLTTGGSTSTQIAFIRNAASQIVTEDTGTPSNNRPLPVKLTGVSGDITITADNLDVQLDHTGANPDSVRVGDGTETIEVNTDGSINSRIGDGTNTLSMNADGSAKVRPETAAASFQAVGKIVGASLTGTYATVVTASSDKKIAMVFNTCDETIFVSFDGGTTDHFELESGESFTIDLANHGLHVANATVIQAKHAGVAPASGSIRISLVG